MNCSRCNAPLIEGARFCRNCGLPIPDGYSAAASNPSYSQPYAPPQANTAPYMPTQAVPPASPMPASQPFAAVPPAQYAQIPPGQFVQQQQVLSPVVRRRRWPKRTVITLIVLLVLVVGGWFLVARPILHAYAQDQLDQAVSGDIGLILPVPPLINSLAATETQINNLIVLNSPSGPVTNAVIHI